MADVRNFKPRLSSSRLFSKGSKDLDSGVVDDKVFNRMTASFEEKKFLTDEVQFEYSAPLIYQLDLLKEDIDDIHAHLSESKYTDNKQKFPVVDVTKEFYVTGTTSLEGNTTISGFTDIRGDFKVNGATVSNLKPSLDFANNLRTKTLVSSSAQISSDISGSFTSLSASIATDINNAGGGTADFSSVGENIVPDGDNTRDLGSSIKEFRNLYIDGIAYLDTIANATINGATMDSNLIFKRAVIQPSAIQVTSIPQTGIIDMRQYSVVEIKQKIGNWSITTARPAAAFQEITIIGLTAGVIRHNSKGTAFTFSFANGSNLAVSAGQAYKFIVDGNNIWRQIH